MHTLLCKIFSNILLDKQAGKYLKRKEGRKEGRRKEGRTEGTTERRNERTKERRKARKKERRKARKKGTKERRKEGKNEGTKNRWRETDDSLQHNSMFFCLHEKNAYSKTDISESI